MRNEDILHVLNGMYNRKFNDMKIYSKGYVKVVLIFFISAVILLALFVIYIEGAGKSTALNYQFSGNVDSVSYNVKGQAYITIKGVQYYLSDPNWDFDHNRIQKGDSLVKKKNSMVIKLYRNGIEVFVEGEDN